MAETYVNTTLAGEKVATQWVNETAMVAPSYFKIGEGGWYTVGADKAQRTPTAGQTDLHCITNPGLYPADSVYVFTKSFVAGDVTAVAGGIVRCNCLILQAEANNDGFGNDPEFWELGIFDSDGVMISYGTFPREQKNALIQIRHTVSIRLV